MSRGWCVDRSPDLLLGIGPVLDADDELPGIRRDVDSLEALDLGAEGVRRPIADPISCLVDDPRDLLEDLVSLRLVELLASVEEELVDVAILEVRLVDGRFGLGAAVVALRPERPDALVTALGDDDVPLVDLVVELDRRRGLEAVELGRETDRLEVLGEDRDPLLDTRE